MGTLRINFSQVPGELEPLPTGIYPAVIVGVEVRESKSGPDPYLNWTLEVVAPEFLGRKVWLITGLGAKALWKLRETLEALGETDLSGEIELDPEKYVGKRCRAVVSQEVYSGQTRNRVDAILPPEPSQRIR
jgi:hypothetical protein